MPKIVLAIGHNWAKATPFSTPDQGATGNGTTEAKTTKAIIDTIIARGIPGFELIKCPEGLGITQRNKWVNSQQNIAAYFEFHLNSATPAAQGCETYFVGGNSWAENEAKQYQIAYTNVTGLKGRGVHADTTDRWGRLGAIRDIKVFGLLMELGFISNFDDLNLIKTKGVDGVIAGMKAMFAS